MRPAGFAPPRRMPSPPPLSRALWIVVPALALALTWITWTHLRRAERLVAVSAQSNWSVDNASPDPASATGYAAGRRQQLVAGGNREAFRWIMTTQAWRAGGPWRVRENRWENAPAGHADATPSLYRAWLRLVAGVSPGPAGLAVETAARRSDPWLHGLLLVGATLFIGLRWHPLAGLLVAATLATVFPLAADFAPGAPHQLALFNGLAACGLIALGQGCRTPAGAGRWFAVAGVAGGLGNWLSPERQVPLLVGFALAGVWCQVRKSTPATSLPWRCWGWAGAGTTLLAWLLEYAPAHLGPDLSVNHPALALSWAGAGEALHHGTTAWRGPDGARQRARRWLCGALLATAAWPLALVFGAGHGPFVLTPAGRSLTATGSWAADSLVDWLTDPTNHTAGRLALLLPLSALVAAVMIGRRRSTTPADRTALILAFGAALAAVALGSWEMSAWSTADTQLIGLAALALAAVRPTLNPRRIGLVTLLALGGGAPGWFLPSLPSADLTRAPLTEGEISSAIERDLAHWFNARTRPEERTVLTSPHLTPALAYYGGIRGLGTLGGDNSDGDRAAIRIVSATSPAETIALLEAREVRYVAVPTWDGLLENYVRIGRKLPPTAALPADTFVAALNRWALPAWLRPVPYPLPAIEGMDGAAVRVFERDDASTAGIALARLAEYFLETGDLASAANLRERLRSFGTEPGTLPALGQIESATGDREALNRTLTALQAAVQSGDFDDAPWDRRVSLAILLTQMKLFEPARAQLRRCLEAADADSLRTLTPGALLKLIALSHLLEVDFPDDALAAEARGLLPPDYRKRLQN